MDRIARRQPGGDGEIDCGRPADRTGRARYPRLDPFRLQPRIADANIDFDGIAAANRVNIERFIQYSLDQGLIREPIEVDALFDRSTLDS